MSSVLATVACLESVTSAVDILTVRNYCFKRKNFLACIHVPVHSFDVIAETVSLLACNILAVLIGVWREQMPVRNAVQ